MKREIEVADAAYGFTWCETEGKFYLRSTDGDYREVNQNVIELLRLFAQEKITVEKLKNQIDGGEPVLDEDSGTSPETVLSLVNEYIESGVLRKNSSIVRLIPPEDIRLWPRVMIFCLSFLFLLSTALLQISELQSVLVNPPSVWILVGLIPVSLVLAGVHELGHYLTADQQFESTMSVSLVNGVIPAFVTDTTGSWVLPQNRRIWINLAGPFVESLVALPIAVVTWYTHSSIFLNMVVFLSIFHIIISLNPLIHGDGYWIICDLFGLVNIRSRGRKAILNRRLSWPAVYVVASHAFATLLVINGVVVAVYSHGVRAIIFIIPFIVIFALSQTNIEIK